MPEHVYRVTEIVGSSPDSVAEAVRTGVRRAAATIRQLEWFEVTEIRGSIADGEVAQFQVSMKVGFKLEDTGGH